MSRALTWIARPTVLVAVVVLISGFQIVRAVTRDRPVMPAIYGEVPEFQLTDQRGRSFGSIQLDGRVWIASFLHTRCGTCLIAQRMTKLQDSIKNATPYLHLVTFTVDPEHDSPEVLSDYAGELRASPRLWTWVTGDKAAAHGVINSLGVSVASGGVVGKSPMSQVDATYVLIDQKMRIRGRYDATSPDKAVTQMMHDAALLLNYPE